MKTFYYFFFMALPLLVNFTMVAEETTIDGNIDMVDSVLMDTHAEEASAIICDEVPDSTDISGQATNGPQLFYEPKTSVYKPHHGMDFTFFKNTTNPNAKPYTFMQDQTWVGVPIFLAGLAAKRKKHAFRQDYNNPNTKIRLIKYNFHSEIDNYTQFAGVGLTVGLKLAGVEGRSSWPRLAASSIASYAVMAALVNGIKYTAREVRPDSSTYNSWPSGHTATAFAAATILHKEYGLTRSPWYSIAGYSIATATGVMRVLNNRHWISDVLSGAGIGILSTELGYGLCDLLFKEKGLLRNDLDIYRLEKESVILLYLDGSRLWQ